MSLVRYLLSKDLVPYGKIGKPLSSFADFKKEPTSWSLTSSTGASSSSL
jgi:hypothetical protein